MGFAVFIDGSRTDVAALYPSAPLHTRAGWGFLVLTNMLPNQGNGTYQFYMYAHDRDGHTDAAGDADDVVRQRQRDETVWHD